MNKYLLLLLPLFLLAVFLFGLAPVEAQYGLDVTVGKTSYSKTDTPESVTTTIINTALYLVYFAFFILVLYAGIRWMTAQGNEEHVTKAKNILEAAIIGLAVISMAYAITNFVLDKVKGSSTAPTIVDKCVDSSCTAPQVCDPNTGNCVDGGALLSKCPAVPCTGSDVCNTATGACEALPPPVTTCPTVPCTGSDVCNTDTGACEAPPPGQYTVSHMTGTGNSYCCKSEFTSCNAGYNYSDCSLAKQGDDIDKVEQCNNEIEQGKASCVSQHCQAGTCS